jgi:diguanylate cyclase (GGDEF)-like protein
VPVEVPLASLRVLAVGSDPGPLAGASVEMAEDLLGALARLADGGIDLVVVSTELPDAQGLEVIRSIRERSPDVPVIAIAEDAETESALEAGAAEVVPDGDGPLLLRAARYAIALHRMRAELHRREIVDPETGLYNARGFEEFAAHHLALAERSGQPLVLLSVRIDPHRRTGHGERDGEGSPVLAETAEVLRASVRDCDVVARRQAGDFCVLLTGDAVGAEALVLARLVDAVAVSNARARRTEPLTLSIAAATYDPAHPVALDELLRQADRELGEPA